MTLSTAFFNKTVQLYYIADFDARKDILILPSSKRIWDWRAECFGFMGPMPMNFTESVPSENIYCVLEI